MVRNELYITLQKEIETIIKVGADLLTDGYNSSNAYIITVSTDYSSIVGQILRHQLTFEGEICDGFGIDVPYPDQKWDEQFEKELLETFKIHLDSLKDKTLILVEAGVIRGSNYTHVVNTMKRVLGLEEKIITVALFENKSSIWKSEYVGEYYNNETEDLTFWWERENNHWK